MEDGSSLTEQPEWLRYSLRGLSARIGVDSRLVQAAGGNTSLKRDGVLHIKASGKWLADGLREEIFVPVDLAGIERGIRENVDYLPEHVMPDGTRLRPSTETSMHTLLPQAVVVHTHSVNTIAWATREDGEERVAERLAGLAWCWIPYVHPGLPLTQQIAARLDGRRVDVLVLGNHGLVVADEDCDAAERLMHEVERRLAQPMRAAPAAGRERLERLAAETGWRLPEADWVHGIGMDAVAAERATRGTMYPDHCVFLGAAAARLRVGETWAEAVARYESEWHGSPKLMVVDGAGVLLWPGANRSAEEMVLCLAHVTLRVPEEAAVRCLERDEVGALLNWDAEKYRQSVAR